MERDPVTDSGADEDAAFDAPLTELDELMHRLVEQAREATSAQTRLRRLLHAHHSVIGELSIDAVLRRIVEAACDLVSAPYAALGVITPDGRTLERFVHVGVDDATVAAIGRLPEGKGVLGALIEDPRPIRLRDIASDARSVGFPEGHPVMRGFLGVPIRVRDEVFGNLYLAGAGEGEFTREDEELLMSLAVTAGVAIENARLYEEARRRQVWLQTTADVTRELLASSGDALRLIGERVLQLAEAEICTVVVPGTEPGRLEVEVAVGEHSERLAGLDFAAESTLSVEVLRTGKPVVVDDASDPEKSGGRVVHLSRVVPVGPCMALPLAGSQGVRGVLVVGRRHRQRGFSTADVDMATGFASQASLALELAEARREAQHLVVLEDRARIARDLHDHVIQQLFATGMTVQSLAAVGGAEPFRARLEGVVDDIDEVIRRIRTSIFQLRPRSLGGGLRAAVLDVVADLGAAFDVEPPVYFAGPVDAVSDAELVHDVRAVVRESLTNTARHAAATTVDVRVEVHDRQLSVVVSDDGVGLGTTGRRSGLANLARRAEDRGGTCDVEPGPRGAGTTVRWRVPVE